MPIEMTSHTLVEKIYAKLRDEIAILERKPALAVILVGHDPGSLAFVAIKQKRAIELGIEFVLHRFDETVSESTLIQVIEKLNIESTVNGIIVQLPLPSQLDPEKILETVNLEKDVDGLRANSLYMPPTILAIMELLASYDIVLKDKKIVIVGKGRLVGGPLLEEFKSLGLDASALDESVSNLGDFTLTADILISATGQANLIQPAMVKDGTVVIDAGSDVDYEQVYEKVAYITPQKGGVGPLTVAFLLANVVEAAKVQSGNGSSNE